MSGRKADPGWNDPPMLNYSTSNPPPKSRITNKRIAFPLNSKNPNPGHAACFPAATQQFDWDTELHLNRIVHNFEVLVEAVDASEHIELRQKLNSLKSSWSELPQGVQKYVYDISVFLREKNAAKANELLLKLTMEFGGSCGQWMGLIRYFINKK